MHLQAVSAEITIKKTTLVSRHPSLSVLPNGKDELSTWKVHKSRPTRPKPNKTGDYHRHGTWGARQTKGGDAAQPDFEAVSLKFDAIRKTAESNYLLFSPFLSRKVEGDQIK